MPGAYTTSGKCQRRPTPLTMEDLEPAPWYPESTNLWSPKIWILEGGGLNQQFPSRNSRTTPPFSSQFGGRQLTQATQHATLTPPCWRKRRVKQHCSKPWLEIPDPIQWPRLGTPAGSGHRQGYELQQLPNKSKETTQRSHDQNTQKKNSTGRGPTARRPDQRKGEGHPVWLTGKAGRNLSEPSVA